MKKYNVAVVGALGLVGTTMVQILEEYDFPVGELKALESNGSRSGKTIEVLNTDAEGRLVLADVLDVAVGENASHRWCSRASPHRPSTRWSRSGKPPAGRADSARPEGAEGRGHHPCSHR